MKQLYTLIFLVFALVSNAQIINFPDANFKAKLLQPNVAADNFSNILNLDANNDGQIEISEVANVYILDVSNASISDLTGISNFANLKNLNCSNNLLTSITINNAISLYGLNASHNALTSVNVNFSDAEGDVDLSYNNLNSLALVNAHFEDRFNVSHNQLTSLLLNNSSFFYFIADYNNLSAIQFTGSVSFNGGGFASFTHNQFSLLRFSNVYFDNSVELYLGDNVIDAVYFDTYQPGNIVYQSTNNTSFDLGNFNMIRDCDPEQQGNVTIRYSPNLAQVIFKNGYNHTTLTCNEGGDIFEIPALNLMISNCPNLSHICVDQGEQPNFQEIINDLGLQNQVAVNTNCTSSVLGTETIAVESFAIFPVPTQNILNLQSNTAIEIKSIEIYNNLGQIVQREIGNHENIDVSKLAKGTYYVKIKTGDSVFNKKFLKE